MKVNELIIYDVLLTQQRALCPIAEKHESSNSAPSAALEDSSARVKRILISHWRTLKRLRTP
jgi:hypothetical protein